MTVELTASQDACQPLSFCPRGVAVVWLPPRREIHPAKGRTRKALLRLTVSFGLGACVMFATATAATAPVSFPARDMASLPEPRIALPPPAQPDLASLVPARDIAEFDPREAIVPVSAADTGDVRAHIIAAMPLTGAEQARGGAKPDGGRPEADAYVHFDGMRVPRWIVETIMQASEATGVDPVYMMALADKESSFLPDNKAATSSAEGLFQFIEGTWLEVVRSFGARHGLRAEAEAIRRTAGRIEVPDEAMRDHILGLRRNPFLSALMAAEMLKRDRATIEEKLGRIISRSEFYLAHFFGVDSASKFMSLVEGKPQQSAPRIFPAAAKANRRLFFEKSGRKTRHLTVAEVYDRIDDMIDRRLERYEDVSALAVSAADL